LKGMVNCFYRQKGWVNAIEAHESMR